jgi:exodeoxyribonuclease-3
MRLFSWNVNGIRAVANKGAFAEFIKQYNPDILGLQETKALQGQAELDLPDYEEYWNSADRLGHFGTAIFTKIKPLSIQNDFSQDITAKYQLTDKYGDTAIEGRVTTAEFEDFYFVTVYTPNSKGDLTRLPMRFNAWDPAFYDHIMQLEQRKPVIFCGDLNVAHQEQDLANPKANVGKHGFTNEERQGFQKFIDAGFIDTFRHFTPEGNGYYTWWTHWANSRARNVGWRIDYFLVSPKLKARIKSAEIHPTQMGSDHCPVSLELK